VRTGRRSGLEDARQAVTLSSMQAVRSVSALGLWVLVACRDSTQTATQPTAPEIAGGETSVDTARSPAQPAAREVAGGETSEFSGGDVPLGYCPVIVSRTPLDLARVDVASWAALAQGHHESGLEWRRASASGADLGVAGHTQVTVDVTAFTAEDVVCSLGDAGGGYETQGIEGSQLRRFDLAVNLSTADRAVSVSFQALFFPLSDVSFVGQRLLSGFAKLPPESASSALLPGIDAGAETTPQALDLDITFDGQSARGTLRFVASAPDAGLERESPWVAVAGSFPPPDAEH
jgi:hypothetical protein